MSGNSWAAVSTLPNYIDQCIKAAIGARLRLGHLCECFLGSNLRVHKCINSSVDMSLLVAHIASRITSRADHQLYDSLKPVNTVNVLTGAFDKPVNLVSGRGLLVE